MQRAGCAKAEAVPTGRPSLNCLVVEPGGCSRVDGIPATLPARGFVWLNGDYDDDRGWVAPVEALTGVQVFENHLLDAENRGHPSYFESTQHYEMIVFRGLAAQPSGGPQEPIRIRTHPTVLFLFPRLLLTLSADKELVAGLQRRLLESGEFSQRLPVRPEELMLRLVNGLVDRYLALRQPLTAWLERWQRELLDPRRPFRDWTALLEARRELRKLESLSEEQLDALQEWRDERLDARGELSERSGQWTDAAGSGPDHATYPHLPMTDAMEVRINDLVQHIERVRNHARRLETSIETAVQLHFSATAHRTNEIIRVLTVLTAIFMPLTLVTGIFGMNFEFIPGLHARSGFWFTVGGMATLAVVLLAFFRARRYLSSTGSSSSHS